VSRPTASTGRHLAAVAVVAVAVAAAVAAHLAWSVDGVLRDPDGAAALVLGVLEREPARSALTDDLARDLAEDAMSALSPEQRAAGAERTLEAAARAAAASEVTDAHLPAFAAWVGEGVVTDAVPPFPDLTAIYEAFEAEVAARDEALLAVVRPVAWGSAEELLREAYLDGELATEGVGLADRLAVVPPLGWTAHLVTLVAALAAVALRRSAGRGVAVALAVPAVLTLLVAAIPAGSGIPRFALRLLAAEAVPGALLTGAVAGAAALLGRRSATSDGSGTVPLPQHLLAG
jgi:hypothetical protein